MEEAEATRNIAHQLHDFIFAQEMDASTRAGRLATAPRCGCTPLPELGLEAVDARRGGRRIVALIVAGARRNPVRKAPAVRRHHQHMQCRNAW